MKFTIHELEYERDIKGYRLFAENGAIYDFPACFLDYVYGCYLQYTELSLGRPLNLIFSNNRYITKGEGSLNISELDDLENVISKLGWISTVGCDKEKENSIIYRYLLCRRVLVALGIPVGYVSKIVLDSDGDYYPSFLSKDEFNGNSKFTMHLSSKVLDENFSLKQLQVSIYHELIHTCKDCFRHGDLYNKYAKLVNDYYQGKII